MGNTARLAGEREPDKGDDHQAKGERETEGKVPWIADGGRREDERCQRRAANAQQTTSAGGEAKETPAPVIWDGSRYQVKPGSHRQTASQGLHKDEHKEQ